VDLDHFLAGFDPLSLSELDARAALLRRVDNKYAVPLRAFAELERRLSDEHQMLEIDGRRIFAYSTTYFDTPDLLCLTDHIHDRAPRFKARTRLYEDSGQCVFEVKIKRSEDETDKRQIDYRQEDRRHLTEAAYDCIRTALDDLGLELPGDLHMTLTTSFRRITLASKAGSDRLTCDFGVKLVAPSEDTAAMHGDLVLVETKSESGNSPADHDLSRMSCDRVSLSKYRVGMVAVGGARDYGPQPGSDLFELRSASG
jgi:hypothetical protein